MKITLHIPDTTPVSVIRQVADNLRLDLSLDGDGLVGTSRTPGPAGGRGPARPLQETEEYPKVNLHTHQWIGLVEGFALGEEFVEFDEPETLIADFDIDPADGEIEVNRVTVDGRDCGLGRKIAAAVDKDQTIIRLIKLDINREIEPPRDYAYLP